MYESAINEGMRKLPRSCIKESIKLCVVFALASKLPLLFVAREQKPKAEVCIPEDAGRWRPAAAKTPTLSLPSSCMPLLKAGTLYNDLHAGIRSTRMRVWCFVDALASQVR